MLSIKKFQIAKDHYKTNIHRLDVPKEVLDEVEVHINYVECSGVIRRLGKKSKPRYIQILKKFWTLELWLNGIKPNEITKNDI